jgi:hypothetical protein
MEPDTMTAEDAMQEIWADLGPDCGPENYAYMVAEVAAMSRYLRKVAPTAPGELPAWLKKDPPI